MSAVCSIGARSLSQSMKMLCRVCGCGSFNAAKEHTKRQMATVANVLKDDVEFFHTESTVDTSEQSSLRTRTLGDGGPNVMKNVPEPPQFCCMSGCANCVWIEYATELTSFYKDGGKTALAEIEKIEDPSLKMILKLQLDMS